VGRIRREFRLGFNSILRWVRWFGAWISGFEDWTGLGIFRIWLSANDTTLLSHRFGDGEEDVYSLQCNWFIVSCMGDHMSTWTVEDRCRALCMIVVVGGAS
jgi:hypothetical protein